MSHILIVDDEEVLRDLLSQILERRGHTCDQAASGVEGCRYVEGGKSAGKSEYDLIITDVRMPTMNGIDFLRKIQPWVRSRTPCMIITALADEPAVAVKAVRLACDFLSKPFEVRTIEDAVDRALDLREAWKFRHLYEKRLEEKLAEKEAELQLTYDGVLVGFAELLEGKDEDLEHESHSLKSHCRRLKHYSRILAGAMGITDPTELRNLELGAMLHDIGKFRIPDRILHKRGKLTEEEWTEMRKHPEYGADAIKKIQFLHGARDVVLHHHERWDGGGYPTQLAGEEIPLAARIFFIADTFDAICENRCYREGRDASVARDEIVKASGTQFDPTCVDAFLRVYDDLVECRRRVHSGEECDGGPSEPVHGTVARDVASELRREVAGGNGLAVSR